jgi:hypothetical protein
MDDVVINKLATIERCLSRNELPTLNFIRLDS